MATFAISYLINIPVEVEVVTGIRDLKVYAEPLYEVPINGIKFGAFHRGTISSMTLKAVNDGEETLNVKVATNPQIITWGNITLSSYDLGILKAGQSATFTLYVNVPVTTVTGNYTFGLVFYEP
jgi:hypothetical protein